MFFQQCSFVSKNWVLSSGREDSTPSDGLGSSQVKLFDLTAFHLEIFTNLRVTTTFLQAWRKQKRKTWFLAISWAARHKLCFGAILRCLGLFGPESTTDWSYHHDTHSAIPSLSFSTLHPEESCWRPPSKFWDFLWNLVTMDHQGSDAVPLAEGFLSQWMAKNGQADLCKHHEMPSII